MPGSESVSAQTGYVRTSGHLLRLYGGAPRGPRAPPIEDPEGLKCRSVAAPEDGLVTLLDWSSMRPLATAKAKRKQGAAGRGGVLVNGRCFLLDSYAGLRGRRSYRSSAPLVSETRTNPDEACSAKGIKSVGEIFVFVWKTLRLRFEFGLVLLIGFAILLD